MPGPEGPIRVGAATGQLTLVPAHVMPLHLSSVVQALPSSQELDAGRAVQVPRVPGTLQAWQSLVPPAHAALQHTPSTQKPLAHWLG